MSNFVRTPAGLRNSHLFYKANFIVYCESHPEKPHQMSWDLGFWQKVIGNFMPLSEVTFKPQGGKSSVIAIAHNLAQSNGHNSICCVDRDFSDIHNEKYNYPFVVNTYGYAFENDICDPSILSHSIDLLIPGITSIKEISELVDTSRLAAKREFRWAVVADQILSLYFLGLFDRNGKKYKSLCDAKGAHGKVLFSRKRGFDRLKTQKCRIIQGRPIQYPSIDYDIWRRMLGHLCWWINFRISRNIMYKLGFKENLSEDTFAGACIKMFGIKLSDDEWPLSLYYKNAIPAAFAASL